MVTNYKKKLNAFYNCALKNTNTPHNYILLGTREYIFKETGFETRMRILEQLGLVMLKSKSCLCSLIDSFTDEGKLSLSSLLFDTSVSFCAF